LLSFAENSGFVQAQGTLPLFAFRAPTVKSKQYAKSTINQRIDPALFRIPIAGALECKNSTGLFSS